MDIRTGKLEGETDAMNIRLQSVESKVRKLESGRQSSLFILVGFRHREVNVLGAGILT